MEVQKFEDFLVQNKLQLYTKDSKGRYSVINCTRKFSINENGFLCTVYRGANYKEISVFKPNMPKFYNNFFDLRGQIIYFIETSHTNVGRDYIRMKASFL